MNIFVLDKQPAAAAAAHADVHAHKMILESAQMMCTAAHLHGVWTPEMYKPTHMKHPCTRWVAEHGNNRAWLEALVHHLHLQRIGPEHKSIRPFYAAFHALPGGDFEKPQRFVQAMPEEFQSDDAVEAYRRYYRWKRTQGIKIEYKSPRVQARKPPTWL